MKILVLTNMYPCAGGEFWKGIFVKEQVQSLRRLFPEVKVRVLHIKGRSSNGGNNFNYLVGAARYLFVRAKETYDVVWSQHAYCALLAALRGGVPRVYTVHEGYLPNTLKQYLVSVAIRLSDAAIFVSHSAFEAAGHNKKFFLPTGVDMDLFRCIDRNSCRLRLALSESKYYVFFPASPNRPEKNAEFAYTFIKRHKDWLDAENIEFIFGGNIEYELMPYWMNAVDCMVSFSDFESDGMVFKEAMACNLPVITFDVGNARIYFKNENAGSIIESRHEFLKDKIAHWKAIGRSHGRDYLLSLGMDEDTVARNLMAVIEQIANARN
jgi:teichuronic acid biosynthesis glycosyltransferase TuaC